MFGRTYVCPNCGGSMEGDGYTTPMTCENAEDIEDCREPDAPPRYCTPNPEKERDV